MLAIAGSPMTMLLTERGRVSTLAWCRDSSMSPRSSPATDGFAAWGTGIGAGTAVRGRRLGTSWAEAADQDIKAARPHKAAMENFIPLIF